MRRITILPVLAVIFAVALPAAHAESPPPFQDFSAKRVKPPEAGTRRRITIQITPEDEAAQRAQPLAAATASSGAGAAGAAWFWNAISPALDQSGPGRLQAALAHLGDPAQTGAVAAPRLQDLQGIAQSQGIEILKATVGTNVSPALVLAVIAIESGGRSDAVSKAGAEGLMQLMPETAKHYGAKDAFEPAQNIRAGVAYLDALMTRFDRDPILVLAGYNAGETAVAEHAGVPPFDETREYVPKVLAAYAVARGLCMTPPELITDGCVFATM